MENTMTNLERAFREYLQDNYSEHEWNKILDEHVQSGEYPQEFLDSTFNYDHDDRDN